MTSISPTSPASPELQTAQYKIGGMACSFCVNSISKALGQMPGVARVHVNLAHEEALLEFDPGLVSEERIKSTLTELGYQIRDANKVRAFEEQAAELAWQRENLLYALLLAFVSFIGMLTMWLNLWPLQRMAVLIWIMPILALTMMFGPGWHILSMAWASLRRGILNQHVLMEFGAFAGLIGGFLGFLYDRFPLADFFAVTVFVTAYHILSSYVSLLVRTRASEAVRKLLDLVPASARVVHKGKELELPLEQVQVGDRVRVRPGESIPVDGIVDEGHSSVDESLVSGESLPLEKSIGSEIVGGSINHTGSLLIRVTRVGEDSFLQQIAHQVEEARALKPSILVLVDRVLQIFVPAVIACAVFAALLWTVVPVMFGGSADGARAVFATLAVLVMGYPCALGMATPLAMINGGGVAAKRGILMRSGEAFQTLKDIDYVVFDKTGTLTLGKPEVTAIHAFGGYSESEILGFAAAIEQQSEHPLAHAVVTAAATRQIESSSPVTDFEASPGGGVSAIIDGNKVTLGNSRFLEQHQIEVAEIDQAVSRMQAEGHTVIILAINRIAVGLLAIADSIKPDARQTIERLQQAGLETMMITGDNQRSARAVAHELGIERFYADVLPRDKANTLRDLQSEGRKVLFVGDGINDSPALMQADVGMAIGAGTDIAIESADIVLLGERLAAVLDSYHIGRASYRKTVQNLCLAFSFNGLGVPLAMTGLVHPVWAMIAMAASVSTVLINSFAGRLVPNNQMYHATSRLTARVPSMHCSSCLSAIERSLKSIPGIVKVNGDPDTKYLDVAYQADVLDPEAISDCLANRSFELQQIKIEPINSAGTGL